MIIAKRCKQKIPFFQIFKFQNLYDSQLRENSKKLIINQFKKKAVKEVHIIEIKNFDDCNLHQKF